LSETVRFSLKASRQKKKIAYSFPFSYLEITKEETFKIRIRNQEFATQL